MDKRKLFHWRRVKSLIKKGIEIVSAQSPSRVVTEVALQAVEWLEHNELGIALDECESVIDEIGSDALPCQLFYQARFEITSYEVGCEIEVELRLDLRDVMSWTAFHSASSQQLGFPGYYGGNMDAWIDCLEEVAEASVGQGRLILRLVNWGESMIFLPQS